MSEDTNEVPKAQGKPIVEKVNTPAGLSIETLLKMQIDTQKQLAEAQAKLAEALVESRKPYVDPKVLEQQKQTLEERRRMVEHDQAVRIATKAGCPHLRDNNTSNIKWMEHSNGIVKGVCGSCRSEFDTRNAKDLDLLRKDLKSQKNMARAGGHTFTRAVGSV